jgi:hypothetical protein
MAGVALGEFAVIGELYRRPDQAFDVVERDSPRAATDIGIGEAEHAAFGERADQHAIAE